MASSSRHVLRDEHAPSASSSRDSSTPIVAVPLSQIDPASKPSTGSIEQEVEDSHQAFTVGEVPSTSGTKNPFSRPSNSSQRGVGVHDHITERRLRGQRLDGLLVRGTSCREVHCH